MTPQLQKRRSTIEEPIALQLNIGEMKTTDGYTLRVCISIPYTLVSNSPYMDFTIIEEQK